MAYNDVIGRSDAAALIPEEASRQIFQNATQQSVVLRTMRQIRMSRKEFRMPVLSTLPTAYWVNGDTGLKQTTKIAWQNKFITAEELAVIVPVPETVIADSDFDIWGEVRPRIAEAIARALDAAVLFGTNKPASWPNSVVQDAAAAGNQLVRGSVSGQDLAGDISDVMKFVESDGFDVSGFMVNTTVRADLRNLRDTQKQFLFSPSMQAGTPDTLWGQPLLWIRNSSFDGTQADVIAGDWNQAVIGIREDISFKILDQAVIQDNTGQIIYNLAQNDMVAMRVVFRAGFQIANPVTLSNTNNATRSPFGVLRPVGWTP